MKIEPLQISGCYKITPRIIADHRGEFIKTYVESGFKEAGLCTSYKEEFFSRSTHHVLRGMHFQVPPNQYVKLVSCLTGRVRDVLLDIRIGSPTYGHCEILELCSEDATILYQPEGIAHGFVVLSDSALVTYKVSCEYAPAQDCGIRWDSIQADWGVCNPTVSQRDAGFPLFSEFSSPFKFKQGYPEK